MQMILKKGPLIFAVTAISFFLLQFVAIGDETYSNFGPDDSFDMGSAWAIGNQSNDNIHFAFPFEALITGELESIEVATILLIENGSDLMEFNLWTDRDFRPDNLLWTGNTLPGATPSIMTIEVEDVAPELTEGTLYWLSARSANAVNFYGWSLNDQNVESGRAVDTQGGTDWDVSPQLADQPAFRVNVSVIPEPGSVLVVAILGMTAICRRRHVCHS